MHLSFDYMKAQLDCNEDRHAQKVMRDLGITYQHSTPQSLGDQFWFWNCENVPKQLPKYITVLDLDPMECIGNGLNKEWAEKIRDYKGVTPLNPTPKDVATTKKIRKKGKR